MNQFINSKLEFLHGCPCLYIRFAVAAAAALQALMLISTDSEIIVEIWKKEIEGEKYSKTDSRHTLWQSKKEKSVNSFNSRMMEENLDFFTNIEFQTVLYIQ